MPLVSILKPGKARTTMELLDPVRVPASNIPVRRNRATPGRPSCPGVFCCGIVWMFFYLLRICFCVPLLHRVVRRGARRVFPPPARANVGLKHFPAALGECPRGLTRWPTPPIGSLSPITRARRGAHARSPIRPWLRVRRLSPPWLPTRNRSFLPGSRGNGARWSDG